MADWPQAQEQQLVVISSVSKESLGVELALTSPTFASAVWPLANLALFIPFLIYTPFLAQKMGVVNGPAGANADVGIYDSGQHRLVSTGSTATPGTTGIQSFDITDTLLEPGQYYMALSGSSSLMQFWRAAPAAEVNRGMGVLEQALGSVTLPDPATFASTTRAYFPAMAVFGRTVV